MITSRRLPGLLLLLQLVLPPATGVAQVCNETDKLLADDGMQEDILGFSVAVADGLVLVGAPGDEDNGRMSGSAYVFDAATGDRVAKLLANDGSAGDQFGRSVAIKNGIAVIGAPESNDNGFDSGSAYLFDARTGLQTGKLTANDGEASDGFGYSVGIQDDAIVIGARGDDDRGPGSGSAYVFDTDGNELMKLLPDQGTDGEAFGSAVAVADGIVAIGAPWGDFGLGPGTAYLFDLSTGTQIARIGPADGDGYDFFGGSIAIGSGIVVVGAKADDDGGSAYTFAASTGEPLAKLLPADGREGDDFGYAVGTADGVAVVGARLHDTSGLDAGAAYTFDASTGQQLDQLLAADGDVSDVFGSSVSVTDGIVAVGAQGDDDRGVGAGAAYLFDLLTCDELHLTASTSCPGSGPATLTASGGSGGRVFFVYSRNGSGSFIVPDGNPCAGTELGLNSPVVLGGIATGNPAVLEAPSVPSGACGRVVIQALDEDACVTSNVVTFD